MAYSLYLYRVLKKNHCAFNFGLFAPITLLKGGLSICFKNEVCTYAKPNINVVYMRQVNIYLEDYSVFEIESSF